MIKGCYLPLKLENFEPEEVLFDAESKLTRSTSNKVQRKIEAPKLEHAKQSCADIKKIVSCCGDLAGSSGYNMHMKTAANLQ